MANNTHLSGCLGGVGELYVNHLLQCPKTLNSSKCSFAISPGLVLTPQRKNWSLKCLVTSTYTASALAPKTCRYELPLYLRDHLSGCVTSLSPPCKFVSLTADDIGITNRGQGFLAGSGGKLSACNAGDSRVWSLGQEEPLEKGMATHFGILAQRIPWTENPSSMMMVGGRLWDWSLNSPSSVAQLGCQWVGSLQPQSHTQATHTLPTQGSLLEELWPVAPLPLPVADCILWQSHTFLKSLSSVFVFLIREDR